MSKQIIITIARESGSGGHFIAEELSKRLKLKLYDKALINEMRFTMIDLEKYDEKPVNILTSRFEEDVAQKTFDFIKEIADRGESCIILGRCAEYVLKGNPNVIKIFIRGDYRAKIKRTMRIYDIQEDGAKEYIKKKDKERKNYHNYHCDFKWGDSRHYDYCLNSSKLGLEKTITLIEEIVKLNIDKQKEKAH